MKKKKEKQLIYDQVGYVNRYASFDELARQVQSIQKFIKAGTISNVSFDADMDFDAFEGLQFRAQRLETDAEFEMRLEKIAKEEEKKKLAKLSKEQRKEIREKNEYLRLKKKFEGDGK